MKWTDWERKLLWRLKDGGLSDAMTATVLSKLLDWPLFPDEVAKEWQASKQNGFSRRMQRSGAKPTVAGTTNEDTRAGRIISCILHHADVYRAGHKPGCGEYEVASDGAIVIPAPTSARQSYCGSSAATCAEFG